MIEHMAEEVAREVRKGNFQLVVDCINVTREMRSKFIDKVKPSTTYVVCIEFEYSKELTLHINNFK